LHNHKRLFQDQFFLNTETKTLKIHPRKRTLPKLHGNLSESKNSTSKLPGINRPQEEAEEEVVAPSLQLLKLSPHPPTKAREGRDDPMDASIHICHREFIHKISYIYLSCLRVPYP
jgi:hypothetical protein